jgi:hypothetical protein
MSRIRRVLAVSLLALPVVAPSTGAQRQLPDLPDYRLMMGPTYSWGVQPGAENPDDPPAPSGGWTVTSTPISDGILHLHVRVVPPEVSLPVEAGPAVLYTTVGLGGGVGGDVGFGRLVSVEPTFLPACTGQPCAFEADVSADLRRLPRIAARVRGLREVWAEVGFTLVRTFGEGAWLQEFETGGDFAGTLRDPARWSEPMFGHGLFPAVGAKAWRDDGKPMDLQEALDHLRTIDQSAPPVTTDVRLVTTFVGCDYPDSGDRLGATIRTAAGDLVTIPRAKGRDFIDTTIALPTGTTWRLGWASDEVFADGTRDVAHSAATFEITERPLLVTAAYRCQEESGSSATDATVAEVIVPEPS